MQKTNKKLQKMSRSSFIVNNREGRERAWNPLFSLARTKQNVDKNQKLEL